jgi:hypothetical protein
MVETVDAVPGRCPRSGFLRADHYTHQDVTDDNPPLVYEAVKLDCTCRTKRACNWTVSVSYLHMNVGFRMCLQIPSVLLLAPDSTRCSLDSG